MNLSGSGNAIHKRALEEVVAVQTLDPIRARIPVKNTEKPPETGSPVKPAEFLSKAETKKVLERFEPLPPVLHKALQETQTLRREFQTLERLTAPRPENHSGPTLSSAVESKTLPTEKPLEVFHRPPVPISPLRAPAPPVEKKEAQKPERETSAPSPGIKTTPAVKIKVESPAAKPPALEPAVKAKIPVATSFKNPEPIPTPKTPVLETKPPSSPAEPLPPHRLAPPLPRPDHPEVLRQALPLKPQPERRPLAPPPPPVEPVIHESLRPPTPERIPAAGIHRGGGNLSHAPVERAGPEKGIVPPSFPQGRLGVRPPLGLGIPEIHRQIPIRASAHSPAALPKPVKSAAIEPLVEKKTGLAVPPPRVMAPQPSIEINTTNQTSTTETVQSKSQTTRPVVLSASGVVETPRGARQRSFLQFQETLKTAGIQNFIEESKQLVHFQGVLPLTPALHPPQGQAAPPPVAPPAGLAFPIETVARNPIHGDNGARTKELSVAQPVAPENVKGAAEPQERARPLPPLTNLQTARRPLPTNVKARLIPVPSVNLLDLVL